MVKENAQVVEVGPNFLKVASLSKSACGSCAAEKGCGQGLLNRWTAQTTLLKLPLGDLDATEFAPNDRVVIGIPENTLVNGALLLYLLPLVFMLAGVWLGNGLTQHDAGVAFMAVVSLFAGAGVARYLLRFMPASLVNPVLLGKAAPSNY